MNTFYVCFLEEEAEAEKTRKKLELDQKKLKEETEFKEVKDELAAAIKRQEQLKQNRVKVFEHLKKLISDPNNKPNLLPELVFHLVYLLYESGILYLYLYFRRDVSKLLTFGIVVTHVNTVPTQPVYLTTVPATVIPRASTVSVNSQYKTSTAAPIPVQVRSRMFSTYYFFISIVTNIFLYEFSRCLLKNVVEVLRHFIQPTIINKLLDLMPFKVSYTYFFKYFYSNEDIESLFVTEFEDTHRNHDYGRGYPYSK